LRRERDDPHGLNGFILLLHLGAGPGRTDELMAALGARGYESVRLGVLLENTRPTR
jgi:hypothetical protein